MKAYGIHQKNSKDKSDPCEQHEALCCATDRLHMLDKYRIVLYRVSFRSTSEKTKEISRVAKFKSFERMSQECPPSPCSRFYIVQPGLTAVETKHLERPKCFESPEATHGQLALS